MNRMRFLAVGIVGVLASNPAYAFQEQSVGVTQGPAAATSSAPPAQLGQPTLPVAPSGTEVRIPGLGKLGTLPKMDFGLELLYGAAETKQIQEPPAAQAEDQELTIRGTLKHRF